MVRNVSFKITAFNADHNKSVAAGQIDFVADEIDVFGRIITVVVVAIGIHAPRHADFLNPVARHENAASRNFFDGVVFHPYVFEPAGRRTRGGVENYAAALVNEHGIDLRHSVFAEFVKTVEITLFDVAFRPVPVYVVNITAGNHQVFVMPRSENVNAAKSFRVRYLDVCQPDVSAAYYNGVIRAVSVDNGLFFPIRSNNERIGLVCGISAYFNAPAESPFQADSERAFFGLIANRVA